MDEELKQICETMYSNAIMHLAKYKIFPSLFFAIVFNGEGQTEYSVMPILFGSEVQNIDIITALHQALSQSDADVFITLFASKSIKTTTEKENELLDYVRTGAPLEDHPDAIESLCLYYMTADGKDIQSIICEVFRDPVGTPYVKDEPKWSENIREDSYLVPPWK